jgi:hypothetical protein
MMKSIIPINASATIPQETPIIKLDQSGYVLYHAGPSINGLVTLVEFRVEFPLSTALFRDI